MRLGIDAQFATYMPRAGLFVHHQQLIRALKALGGIDTTLFLNGWSLPSEQHASVSGAVSASLDDLPTYVTTVPGKLRSIRLRFSPLGKLDVFYHVFTGTFDVIPELANVFLVPDLIPLTIDYPGIPRFRERSAAYYQKAANYADAIVVYSGHTKSELQSKLGVAADRIIVTPLGASPQYRPIEDHSIIDSYLRAIGIGASPYILAVGTLEVRKNIEVLVRAFAQLKRLEPRLPHKLVLCGSKGVGHEAIFSAIEEEGIAEQVMALGYAEHPELLYNGASLFAFPSRYEGFGLPPLEAMACGTPVVAADATSVPEVVGEAGMLFEVSNVERLCGAMRKVLLDAPLAARMREAGLQRAQQFTWHRTAELTRDAFSIALEHRRHRLGRS